MEEVIVSLISSIKSQWLIGVIVIGWGAGKLFKPFFDLQLKNIEKKEDSEIKAHESSFKLIETLVSSQIESGREMAKEMAKAVSDSISLGFEKVCNTLHQHANQHLGDHGEIKQALEKHSETLEAIKNKLGA